MIKYLKAFFLSTEFIPLAALNYLLGTEVIEKVVTCVSKGAKVGVGSGAQTKHGIPGVPSRYNYIDRWESDIP